MKANAMEASDFRMAGDVARVLVLVGVRPHDVSFRVSSGIVDSDSSFALPLALLPAMRVSRALRIDGSVSPRLLSSISGIQGLLSDWNLGFHRIPVEARMRPTRIIPTGRGVAGFFSAGVDSFYSVLRHLDEITDLVFVRDWGVSGVDISSAVRQAAADLGKPLVQVDTNLQTFSDQYVHWSFYHGAAMAAVALLLSSLFRKVYLASGMYGETFPYGSHPRLDPLWSTEHTEIVHDSAEATRLEKLAVIAEHDVAMRWLRVCPGADGAYNCGRCEKCLRTMVGLRLVGGLACCRTFPERLDLKAISRTWLRPTVRTLWEENLRAAEERGDDPKLVLALRRSLKGWIWRAIARPILRPVRPIRRYFAKRKLRLSVQRGTLTGFSWEVKPSRGR